MTDTIERAEDLLEVQSWLEGWGDYNSRESNNNNLGYQSPCAILMRDNVQQSRGSIRPVLFDMDDEAYYTLIDRELGRMRISGDKELKMFASIIKRYYLYRMPYRRISKSVVSKYEYGNDTNITCHVRKVKAYLAEAERHIYCAILDD